MMRRAVPVAVALVSATAGAQPDREQRERFQLFTGCAPLVLNVLPAPDRPDFTAAVTAAAESRLRADRLFQSGPRTTRARTREPWLEVRVSRLEIDNRGLGPFIVEIGLMKPVEDLNGLIYRAETWRASLIGSGSADYILIAVSRAFDQFLSAYLRVNAEACE